MWPGQSTGGAHGDGTGLAITLSVATVHAATACAGASGRAICHLGGGAVEKNVKIVESFSPEAEEQLAELGARQQQQQQLAHDRAGAVAASGRGRRRLAAPEQLHERPAQPRDGHEDHLGELGEEHDPETHAIPLAIMAALGTGPSFRIFGADYDTPDGTCVRDYVHVSDLAAAHVAALRMLEQGHGNRAWNVCTGRGHSVLEIIAAIEAATGRPVRAEYAGRRPGDPPRLVADASLIQQQTTWRPQHSSIGNIIATAWAWHQGRPT